MKKSTYGPAVDIEAEIWPANGRLQAEIYGQRLPYIFNCLMDIDHEVKEKDGICIDGDEVVYKVISIKRYSNHQLLELEQCRS